MLPIFDRELFRISEECFRDSWGRIENLRREHEDDWREPQPLDLVEPTPLLPASEHSSPSQIPASAVLAADHSYDDPDVISIIASDDGDSEPEHKHPNRDHEYDLRILREHGPQLPTPKELRTPVVSVWYDLDMVTEIVDPVHFLQDVKRLHAYVALESFPLSAVLTVT